MSRGGLRLRRHKGIITPGPTFLAFKNYKTVGSMTAGTNVLTVRDNPGFKVNDPIIVEIGGEPGGGLRGTHGVGGEWPALYYANAAARAADATQANNTYAWQEDTGQVWRWVSSAWVEQDETTYGYYISKAVPRSLLTTISSINGLEFTLAASCVAGTTNANVYFDNEPYASTIGAAGSGFTPTNNQLWLPDGRYAIGKRWLISQHDNWQVLGFGDTRSVLFSPKGVASFCMFVHQSSDNLLQDFGTEGNAGLQQYGLDYRFMSETSAGVNGIGQFSEGLWAQSTVDQMIRRVRGKDHFQHAFGGQFCTRQKIHSTSWVLTDPNWFYIQWQTQFVDGVEEAECIGQTGDSNYLTGGFNAFRTDNVKFRNLTSRNGTFASNSTGGWEFSDIECTIEALSQYSERSFAENNPVLNINSNIQPPSAGMLQGGLAEGVNLIQEGAINGDGDVLKSITVNEDCPNVTIRGCHIEHPTCNMAAASGILVTSEGGLVEENRVIGTNSNAFWGNIRAHSAGADCIIQNNIADKILLGTTDITNLNGNQPNP